MCGKHQLETRRDHTEPPPFRQLEFASILHISLAFHDVLVLPLLCTIAVPPVLFQRCVRSMVAHNCDTLRKR